MCYGREGGSIRMWLFLGNYITFRGSQMALGTHLHFGFLLLTARTDSDRVTEETVTSKSVEQTLPCVEIEKK